MNGKKVTILFPEAGINARLFPPDLAAFLNDYYRQKGVEVLAGELVSGMAQRGQQSVVRTQSGREIVSDGVVAGIGILPNLELARSAEVAVDDGILVDEFLRTNAPDVFAAGDGVSFHSKALGKRMRVEHEDHALTTGMIAGQNMANSLVSEGLQAYHHLPFFYSDLFDLGYEAVGELDPALDIVADWQTPFRKGTVYYLKSGRVRGVLLWDVWGKVDAARQMIEAPGPFTEDELMGRLAE
jgi:NADPH-dependent 2,4-dienoyl-CoA reductase/sulfur reductase-like enzyme